MTFKKILAIFVFPLVLASCGDSEPLDTAGRTTTGIYKLLRDAVGIGNNDTPQETGQGPGLNPGLPGLEIVCPVAEVRAGTAHYIFYAPDLTPQPRNVQFQGTLTKTARECAFGQNSVRIKFGFAGRVLVGPQGGPGAVTLPIRAILSYREGAVAWTKVYNLPVNIPPNERSTFFMHVEENFEYVVPQGHRLSDYAIYIGFDGDAVEGNQSVN